MTCLLDTLQARAGEFISLRRDIHRHPELAFEEHHTAALVAEKLEGWGYAVERGLDGALRMMTDGLFERFPCDAVFAMHNRPGLEQGRLVLREGAAMASSDCATVTLRGIGGHGAMPHQTADPIVAAASIVWALQTIVWRNIDIGSACWVLLVQRFLTAEERSETQ